MMRRAVIAIAFLALAAVPARAGLAYDPGLAGFQPRVPISQLGRLGSWFDPSRFRMSSSLTVGSGFGAGTQTSALNVTSFSYQFKAPITMQVRLGNAFGPGAAKNGSSFFLEGLEMSYQPNANTLFHVQFQNVRSPLQLHRYGSGWGAPGSWNGY